MKVLWITNILLPEATEMLGKGKALKGSGGWLIGAATALLQTNEVELYIAAPTTHTKNLKKIVGNKIVYYAIPRPSNQFKYWRKYEYYWKIIQSEVKPDIVHIHGTEFSHGLAYVRACGADNVVASIQGMTSVYWKHYADGLSLRTILCNTSLVELIRGSSLWQTQNKIKKVGRYEIECIASVSHVIGRTFWDRAHTWAINPSIHYHFCNETLRDVFYYGQWSYVGCKKHSIFVAQAKNSIKGFHQLLLALPLILREFPDTEIRVPGAFSLDAKTFIHKIIESGYSRYLRSLIKHNELQNHIVFLGALSGEEMKMELLRANVFISPSSIENSPNSVGEAQILGTPCISSDVGGVCDMIQHGVSGFIYRFEEIEMLARYVCDIFSGRVDVDSISNNERECARLRHDRERNCETMINIYKSML